MNENDICGRCGVGQLKGWAELTEDERFVVERLPASADYPHDQRKQTHRWCTRCWFEEQNDQMNA